MGCESVTKYQHYKGGIYTLIGCGKHTESREELVAYTDKYGELHFRPKDMFLGKVEVEGVMVDRFKEIKEERIESIEDGLIGSICRRCKQWIFHDWYMCDNAPEGKSDTGVLLLPIKVCANFDGE